MTRQEDLKGLKCWELNTLRGGKSKFTTTKSKKKHQVPAKTWPLRLDEEENPNSIYIGTGNKNNNKKWQTKMKYTFLCYVTHTHTQKIQSKRIFFQAFPFFWVKITTNIKHMEHKHTHTHTHVWH